MAEPWNLSRGRKLQGCIPLGRDAQKNFLHLASEATGVYKDGREGWAIILIKQTASAIEHHELTSEPARRYRHTGACTFNENGRWMLYFDYYDMDESDKGKSGYLHNPPIDLGPAVK